MRPARQLHARDGSARVMKLKKALMRLSVFVVAAFVIFQVNVAGDPVALYLQVVGDAVSPTMLFSDSNDHDQDDMLIEDVYGTSGSVEVFLKTTPAQAGLRVWQDEKNLGVISEEGKTFAVKPGRVLLDARGLGEGIRVEIHSLGKKYFIDMTEEIVAFDVRR